MSSVMSLDVSGHGDPTPITAVLLLGLVADAAEVGFGQNVLAFISASVFQWIWMTWGLGEYGRSGAHGARDVPRKHGFCSSMHFVSSAHRYSRPPFFFTVFIPKTLWHVSSYLQHPSIVGCVLHGRKGGGERDDDKCAVAVRALVVGGCKFVSCEDLKEVEHATSNHQVSISFVSWVQ
ncbi:hypothetical protein OPV22_003542 [Ensete ventricosum]|uniref:Uncharacterized protein n=1 Tax=Ensete ventricosum TaxID=4639 RepID=A0AAV8S0W2_ENSVE|nr:hypothetical protein OPV22_003542 [Ensete ventricosum]